LTLYLLDTSVLIDLQHRLPATQLFVARAVASADTLASCAVTVAEFRSGSPRGHSMPIDAFMDLLLDLPLTPAIAEKAGDYRFRLAGLGVQVSIADALIAATALAHGATLVTENRKDFPMDDLTVLSLRPEPRAT